MWASTDIKESLQPTTRRTRSRFSAISAICQHLWTTADDLENIGRRYLLLPGGTHFRLGQKQRSSALFTGAPAASEERRGVADQENLEGADSLEEIVRLEEHIEQLAGKIESCRKFILAARIAVASGAVVLAAMLVGVIQSDLGPLAAAVSLLLGGIVVWGSNNSTAKEATKELAEAESERSALIEKINAQSSHSEQLCKPRAR
jgi:hypothetical protein